MDVLTLCTRGVEKQDEEGWEISVLALEGIKNIAITSAAIANLCSCSEIPRRSAQFILHGRQEMPVYPPSAWIPRGQTSE